MKQARAVSCTAVALTCMLASCAEPPTLSSTGDQPSTTASPLAARPGTMTLITGDRVTLPSAADERSGGGRPAPAAAPAIVPGTGRDQMSFTIAQRDGELTVVPRDMAPLIASGQLDPQLFNVTRLIADGFGDDQRHDLPLFVSGPQASQPATAVRQDKGAMSPLLAGLVAPGDGMTRPTKIWLDRPGADGALRRAPTASSAPRAAAAFDLTLSVLDAAGNNVGGTVIVNGADPGTEGFTDFLTGTKTYHLPAGRYFVWTFDASATAILVAPRFALTHNSKLVMDGRLSKPLDIDVVGQHLVSGNPAWVVKDIPASTSFGASGPLPLRAGQIGPDAPPGEISSTVSATLLPVGQPTQPSDVYIVARFVADQFFTGWKQTLRGRDFANVHVRAAGAEDTQFTRSIGAIPPDNNSLSPLPVAYTGPFETTEHYYGVGFQWLSSLAQGDELGFETEGLSQIAEHRAGTTTGESWNRGPLAPAFPGIRQGPFGVLGSPRREGDFVFVAPSMLSDQSRPARDSSLGFSDTVTGRLLRNGEVIQDFFFGFFEATPEPAEYRIEQNVTRPADLFDRSTEVSAAWTFRTQHTDAAFEILPLPSLRFAPDLDEHNETHARALALPIHVERVAGAPTPRITSVRVDVSFDDGATWARLPLIVLGDDALGLIVHPPGATHVSLRGHTADVAGNAEDMTVIRAYRIAR